ncbi:hypothetical protein EVAR_78373_1 [Eumeta japonica]|uniref:Uncharacterized protein n=1 Tax=Eumeta variegata TaxID=151549 RepID=A0A4C1T6G2_EUMVA|nr:hypothetical protein EVAR_78373_1 [Eumeta japonica]
MLSTERSSDVVWDTVTTAASAARSACGYDRGSAQEGGRAVEHKKKKGILIPIFVARVPPVVSSYTPDIRGAPISATRVVAPRLFPVLRTATGACLSTSPSLPEAAVTIEDGVGVPTDNSS